MASDALRIPIEPTTTPKGEKALVDISKQLDDLVETTKSQLEVEIGTAKAKESLEKLTGLAKAALTFEAAERGAAFLSGVAEKAESANKALRTLQAQTGASDDKLSQLSSTADRLFAAGIGDGFDDAVRAIGEADRQLGEFLDPKGLETFTRTAGGIAQVFDQDINEVLAKSRTFIKNFGLDGEEASNLVSGLFQGAGNASGDALDTLDEYSQLLVQAGFNAEQFTGILIEGTKQGARDTDKLADTIKETQIRLRAGDITNTLKDIQSPISEAISGIVRAGEAGTISVRDVLSQANEQIERAFSEGQITESIRAQLQVALSGTPAEDLGSDLYGRIFGADIPAESISKAGADARAQIESAIGPTDIISQTLRSIEGLGSKLAAEFQPAISGGAALLQTVSSVAPGVFLLRDSFGALNATLGPVVQAILSRLIPGLGAQAVATATATGATVAQTTATGVLSGALRALWATMLSNPITLVIAGAVALGAALAAILSGGESLAESLEDVNSELDTTNQVLSDTAKIDESADRVLKLADSYDRLKDSTAPEDQAEFAAASDALASAVPEAVTGIRELAEEGGRVAEQFTISTDVARNFADAQKEMARDIRAGAIEKLVEETAELAENYRDAQEEVKDLKEDQADLRESLIEGPGAVEAVFKSLTGRMREVTDGGETFRDRLSEATSELADQQLLIEQSQERLGQTAKVLREQGFSWDYITNRLGLSTEEAKLFVKNVEDAELAAKKAERGIESMHAQTVQQADVTKGLAADWDRVTGSVSGAVDEMLKATAFLILQGREARAGGGIFSNLIGDALREAQISALKEDLRDQIQTMKELDGIIGDLKAELGLVDRTARPVTEKTAEGITKITLELTDLYQTAVENIRKLGAEAEEAGLSASGRAFEALSASFEEQLRQTNKDFADELDALNRTVAEKQAEFDALIKEGKKASIEFSLELEDGTVLKGVQAIEEAQKVLEQNRKAEEEKLGRERIERERDLARKIADERLQVERDALAEELELERERLEFREEFRDESTVEGLKELQVVRIALLEQERDAQIRTIIEGSDAFIDGQRAITEAFADRINEIEAGLRAEALTEAEAQSARLKAEEKVLGDIAELRETLIGDALADDDSRASAAFEAFGERAKLVIAEIGIKIRELQNDFDFLEDLTTQTTRTLVDSWRKFYDDLQKLREEDLKNAKETRDEDVAELKKDLLEFRITYEEFTRQLAQVRAKDSDDSKAGADEALSFWASYAEFLRQSTRDIASSQSDALRSFLDAQRDIWRTEIEAADDATDATKAALADMESAWQVVERASAISAQAIIGSFTALAIEGGAQAESFAIALIDAIAQTLDSVIPALIAIIWGKSFAENPLTGGLLAAGITATLLALAAAAKSELAKGLGSRQSGGYAGDGRPSDVMGVYHGGEFIHTAGATKRFRDLFEHIHAGGDPSEYFIDRFGRLGRSEKLSLISQILSPTETRALLLDERRAVLDTRSIISAIHAQTSDLRSEISTLAREFEDVKATFHSSRDVSIAAEGRISGQDIELVFNKRRALALSG